MRYSVHVIGQTPSWCTRAIDEMINQKRFNRFHWEITAGWSIMWCSKKKKLIKSKPHSTVQRERVGTSKTFQINWIKPDTNGNFICQPNTILIVSFDFILALMASYAMEFILTLQTFSICFIDRWSYRLISFRDGNKSIIDSVITMSFVCQFFQ